MIECKHRSDSKATFYCKRVIHISASKATRFADIQATKQQFKTVILITDSIILNTWK